MCDGRGKMRLCWQGDLMDRLVKIVVEKHTDGYVAYPLGLKGVVVGEGDSNEEALADVKSAIRFHAATFGGGIGAPNSPGGGGPPCAHGQASRA